MRGQIRALRAWLGLAVFLMTATQVSALEAEELVPMGSAVGIELATDGVLVVGLTDVETDQGTVRPAEDGGLQTGDVILQIGDRETPGAAEFLTAMSAADGGTLLITVQRDGKKLEFPVTPAKNREGTWQMGLWLRDGVSGIGTVTFFDPESGVFGALGHGINDTDTGELLPFEGGSITQASVVDVVPGNPGSPGELCGRLDRETVIGILEKNTESGIFGTAWLTDAGTPVPVAKEDEVTLGPATILSSVTGDGVREYTVEINRIYHDPDDSRFLLLTVTDPALLEVTGGIVQGMSGSPILQNGKLVGAVTHVLVNQPSKGYGISIQEMMNAA